MLGIIAGLVAGHFGGRLSEGHCYCFELRAGKGRGVGGACLVHERRWCIHLGHLLVTQPVFPITERAQSSQTKIQVGLGPQHAPHRESEATPPRVTPRTYLLLGEQGPHIKRLAHLPHLSACMIQWGFQTWKKLPG
ncbi:hypothetical protein E2C01_087611 [Portunus trituberculatus]|uniref:Uncharacterized protein n=1 Tax=Portunus trituberculatus TaxID=210409 RepID=A0A5B7JHR4_PORTR|nr:hypothetical protein [Portunus trituberculatus]